MGAWIEEIIANYDVRASAPCRVDMGGTLDIGTFFYPLQHADPCTFNMALNLRTRVDLHAFRPGWIKVSSRGFESAAFRLQDAPFNHHLGLMFATAAHFNAAGLHIKIDSASPPRGALGGSSVAAVALVAALARCRVLAGGQDLSRGQIVHRAHQIEETVAGVPCGIQDQLGAAYGGMNTWQWTVDSDGLSVHRQTLLPHLSPDEFKSHFLVAYCGQPHESRDVNGTWVRRFLAGKERQEWIRIIECVHRFNQALKESRWSEAATAMNEETTIRCSMTPEVLDDIGEKLVQAARDQGCGGRFTGAGGGGCLWAVGEDKAMKLLREDWEDILTQRPEAQLLNVGPDTDGLVVSSQPRNEIS